MFCQEKPQVQAKITPAKAARPVETRHFYG
jgi:hypothetical protein